MNLIALLIGLGIERMATQLFHLRELRWLDKIIDWGFAQTRYFAGLPPLLLVMLLVLLLMSPVFALLVFFADGGGFSSLLLSVLVLFFSLGPKDIGEEIDDYCDAVEQGDDEAIDRLARAIAEDEIPDDPMARTRMVEEAVFVQSNNRLFAVIFWFIVSGPLGALGAWTYRVSDLVRRRAVFRESRSAVDDSGAAAFRSAATRLHGLLAWIPARLTAIGYAVAGHFDDALAAFRTPTEQLEGGLSAQSDRLLARVGVAALALNYNDDQAVQERSIKGVRAARHLVFRLLLVWAVLIAAMTLYGLTQ